MIPSNKKDKVVKAYKFRIYPTNVQQEELDKHLWLSKNLWNELLAHNKQMYNDFGYFATKNTMQKMAKGYGLYSQTQEVLTHRLYNSLLRYFKLKKQNKKVGFPRFKSIDRMKSLIYPQHKSGFWLEKKLKVTPFGEIAIKKHRTTDGEIKSLTLKKSPSGKWFAVFCVKKEAKIPKQNNSREIGIDLGLIKFATLSDGTRIDNPRHFKKMEDKLAFEQRRLSRKMRRSRNRSKQRIRVAKIHEKISDARDDFLHKRSKQFVNAYSLIALEKLQSKEMAEQDYGKSIHDAGWGKFADMLSYKAAEAGCKVIFVNPKNTTKKCSNCGKLAAKTLQDRIHKCDCGLEIDRDINAAINILALAKQDTSGQGGINACGDVVVATSLKQEAHVL